MLRKKKQPDLDELELASTLGFVRAVVGAVLFFAPRFSARVWTGEDIRGATSYLAVRGMGARDLALGVGLLLAIERGGSVRGWLEAGALADSADAAGTLMQWGSLGTPRALALMAGEVGAAVMGSRLAQSLD